MSNIQPYIILNGTDSRSISGLLISSLPPISKPQVRTQIETVDGRDGDIVTPLGFSAYDKVIKIGLTYNYDVDEIIEFFNSEGIVTFSNEPDKYYRYAIYEQIDFEKLIRFKTAEVVLHVQPFKFSTTEEPELFDVVSGQAIAVTNEGNTDSRPNLTIIGSGDIDVSLNGSQILSIELEDDQAVIIDSEDMNAYAAQSAIREVVADVDPIQDLNGYSSVWIGGAGKNKLENTSTVTTLNSVTYTKNEDGSVKLTGTASAATNATYINFFTLPSGTYIFTDNTTSSDCYLYLLIEGSSTWYRDGDTFTVDGNTRTRVVTFVTNGAATNITLYPMIRLASVSDASFEPYENIGEISGYTSANVNLCGKNFLNKESFKNLVSNYDYAEVGYRCKKIQLKPNTTYTVSTTASEAQSSPIILINNNTAVNTSGFTDLRATSDIKTYTTDESGCLYIGVYPNISDAVYNARIDACSIQIELGSQATEFEDYTGETYNILFVDDQGDPITVYGGSLNVTTGELIINKGYKDLGGLTWNKTSNRFYAVISEQRLNTELVCSHYKQKTSGSVENMENGTIWNVNYTFNPKNVVVRDDSKLDMTGAQFKAAMSGVQLVFELADPITVQLTPTQIYNLLGVNNMYSDTGDITVKHKANGVIVTDTGSIVSFSAGLDDIEKGVLLNRAITGDYDKIRLRKGVNTFVLTGNAQQFAIDKYSRWI